MLHRALAPGFSFHRYVAHVTLWSMDKKYRIGIDVGLNSVGFAAIEVDGQGKPLSILNSVVYVHDAGVDPTTNKTGETRKSVSGAARRARRLVRHRKKRLAELDSYLESLGLPLPNLEDFADPYEPWLTRKQLVEEKLSGEDQKEALSIAIRHMARHRGWRSPWERVESLHAQSDDSKFLEEFRTKVTEEAGLVLDEGLTPAQIVCEFALSNKVRIRGPESKSEDVLVVPLQKIHQSDNANELRKIGQMQGLSDEIVNNLIDKVFVAKSPKGKSGEKAGYDALPGQGGKRRAGKYTLAFQRFKIISVVANLRIAKEPLTPDEKNVVIDFLMNADGKDRVTWFDVADKLGIDRDALEGTASQSMDGERPSANPPTNVTNERILTSSAKNLKKWWKTAGVDAQEALLAYISNADALDPNAPGADSAEEFLAATSEDDLLSLDKISQVLPKGRAAYSLDSLQKLSDYMFTHSVDLFTARKAVFGVPDDWAPPADPIGLPVGNPAVDRVLKIVNRYLNAAVRQWGEPERVNIEHVRSGFGSVKMAREYERDLANRNKRNQDIVEQMHRELDISAPSRSDRERYAAVRRQKCQCLYCGHTIKYDTCQMDHIVPRKGQGSTNTRDNLVAVCSDCNLDKSNLPFAVWAAKKPRKGVSLDEAYERLISWDNDGMSVKEWRNYKQAIWSRLRKTTEDEPIDSRSIESVAWMANELRARISGAYTDTKVQVYRGAITAEARKASGFEGKVKLIGGNGKTRLDRRHHAMDAATIALMRDGVAQVLAIRDNMHQTSRVTEGCVCRDWKEYRGREGAQREHFDEWAQSMDTLLEFFNSAVERDEIPVMQNTRLRLGNSVAHDATIHKMVGKKIGEAWSVAEIDQAETPALWSALTRHPDFDEKDGLSANGHRTISVNGMHLGADDKVGIFGKNIAAIKVRDGWAEIGSTIHHARIYRINGKKTVYAMVRVFETDLLRHRNEDLFTVELPEHSISMRTAEPKLRQALKESTAEYLGWIVAGDELVLDLSSETFKKGLVGTMQKTFAMPSKWRLEGFPTGKQLRLRPVMLAGEGLKKTDIDIDDKGDIEKILNGQGWWPAVNVLLGSAKLQVIRRNALGWERWHSTKGLPTSMCFV